MRTNLAHVSPICICMNRRGLRDWNKFGRLSEPCNLYRLTDDDPVYSILRARYIRGIGTSSLFLITKVAKEIKGIRCEVLKRCSPCKRRGKYLGIPPPEVLFHSAGWKATFLKKAQEEYTDALHCLNLCTCMRCHIRNNPCTCFDFDKTV